MQSRYNSSEHRVRVLAVNSRRLLGILIVSAAIKSKANRARRLVPWVGLLAALWFALPCGVAEAAIYMWTDANGVMHFTDYPKNDKFVSYLQDSPRSRQLAGWDRQTIQAEIKRLSKAHGLDHNLVEKVVWAESDYDIFAVSHKGAMGLMQLMPGTAKLLGVSEPFDPVQNLDGGIRYLRYLIDRFRGKLDWALAAYNAGERRVEEHGGVPPYPETRKYVDRILNAYLNRK